MSGDFVPVQADSLDNQCNELATIGQTGDRHDHEALGTPSGKTNDGNQRMRVGLRGGIDGNENECRVNANEEHHQGRM